MLDKDDSGMVEFPEFVRVMAKRAEVEAIKKKTEEFREALKVKLETIYSSEPVNSFLL